MPAFIYSSIFRELTRRVQIRFDKISQYNKQVFDNVLFEQYLDWDTPTIGLNFEEIIGKYNITIAAPTIGDDSKESILGTEGLSTLAERIVRHALTVPMSITDYRKVLQILDSRMLDDTTKAKQLTDIMWGNVTTVVNAVRAKIDLIFIGALSNEGKFEFTPENNPEGGVRGLIDYGQPADNIATSKTQWTAANIDTVDCFEDIQSILDAAQDKVQFGSILCSPSAVSYMCRSKKMKLMLNGSDKSSRIVQLKDINEYMQENEFPTFKTIRRQIRIQRPGQTPLVLTPWNANNIVFIPSGKLGLIKNAYANNEIRQEPGVAYSNYGRIRVSQWGVGETQGSNGVEFTKAECFALPVITEMNGIYTLKTKTT